MATQLPCRDVIDLFETLTETARAEGFDVSDAHINNKGETVNIVVPVSYNHE
jgi:hypothetical protein